MKIASIFESMEYGPAPESQATAEEWLAQQKPHCKQFINGSWVEPKSQKYLVSKNPCSGKKIASIPLSSNEDVDDAVNAASKALSSWQKLGHHARARYLYAIARQLQKHARIFAVLESLDNGKPIRETRDIDIPLVIRHFYYHAGWAQIAESKLKDYEPIGVVGQIIPWNFPMLMLAWKVAPALAMGNTVVLKPAEYTSLTALLFAEICEKAGLPAGVLNIITGDGTTGAALVEHPDIAKIAFTGSTEVGKIIRRATANTEKKLSLELGGKSPFIVFEDADLDSAVEGIVDAIWFNQGQVCCAGSRLLVQESTADKLYKKIKRRMEKLRIGNALDKGIDVGAIIAPVQLKTIEELVKKGVEDGADLFQPAWECPNDGCYYPPSLFTNVAPSSLIAQEEIFGPVLVAMSFRTPVEAVKLANNTRYGLAASIWTENINLALDIAPKVKAGTIWINSTNTFDAASGFGGYRESGFGREGGIEGLNEYIKPKIEREFKDLKPKKEVQLHHENPKKGLPAIDKTAKLYIGGKQVRPDSGYSLEIGDTKGKVIGLVGEGNRKDIRNAVEAAHAAGAWAAATAHNRAQVLYYLAENLEIRRSEFIDRIGEQLNQSNRVARKEFDLSIERLFTYAAYTDKFDSHVHATPYRNVTLAMKEPIGVLGIVCPDELPLLGLISTIIPAIAMGNRVVAVPSETAPLSATDLYQVFETSDIPAGVVNLVTGKKDELADVLAKHDNVDGLWYFGSKEGSSNVQLNATENMKRTWVNFGRTRDWFNPQHVNPEYFLTKATEIKNIWVPYGE
jgi:aldehyde dehydrogenase (NAD+)